MLFLLFKHRVGRSQCGLWNLSHCRTLHKVSNSTCNKFNYQCFELWGFPSFSRIFDICWCWLLISFHLLSIFKLKNRWKINRIAEMLVRTVREVHLKTVNVTVAVIHNSIQVIFVQKRTTKIPYASSYILY